jgi:lipopolysaccharide/colanic/teichoic acid biosynthesis glycosyltransferase
MKRGFDLVLALFMLLLVAPLALCIVILIALESRGPILFGQRRVGLGGRTILVYKFRTMVVDAPEIATGAAFNLRADSRITRVGRFLRQTSLDELPQLFNIVLGDMSFVGPRAAMPWEVDRYSERERQRLHLKPGITGYWQAFGRVGHETDFQQMIDMDIEYLHKQSLSLDLRILWRTAAIVFGRASAY